MSITISGAEEFEYICQKYEQARKYYLALATINIYADDPVIRTLKDDQYKCAYDEFIKWKILRDQLSPKKESK